MKNLEGDSSTENPILKDLRVYTELSKSGLIEVEDGFLIFFISEGPESLNNQNTQNKVEPAFYILKKKNCGTTNPRCKWLSVIPRRKSSGNSAGLPLFTQNSRN